MSKIERRDFLKAMGVAVLSIKAMPAQSEAQDSNDEILSIRSGTGRVIDHHHLLKIPVSALRSPPTEGISLKTEKAFMHRHTVPITQDQLKTIAAGGTVKIGQDVADHEFAIGLHLHVEG